MNTILILGFMMFYASQGVLEVFYHEYFPASVEGDLEFNTGEFAFSYWCVLCFPLFSNKPFLLVQ